MYLIAMQKGGHQAIPIKSGDKWDFHKLLVGRKEVRIILRVRGRRYLLYHTREVTAKYPKLTRVPLMLLCDEIIATASDHISQREYVDFNKISAAAECRHLRRWRDQGLITPATPELYHGHPIDAQAEQLVSRVRVDVGDIIVMDHEPPVDCEQVELPY